MKSQTGPSGPMEVIAVDFDGTLCENRYPEIGTPRMDIIRQLWARQEDGAKVILWTCRRDELLDNAIDWCAEQGIKLDAVNESLPEWVEFYGSDTRKVGATEYWDDRAVNCAAVTGCGARRTKKQCVVRTYAQWNAPREDKLQELLDGGWTVAHITTFSTTRGATEFVEYILEDVEWR
jgi:hypothetical protein